MGRPTYLTDAYRARIATRVEAVAGDSIRCADTVFHPQGGGQPGDAGRVVWAGGAFAVTSTEDREGAVWHVGAPGSSPPPEGAEVTLELDWPRRYRFMRYHTALHLLSGVVHQRFGSGITGNQIAEDRARMDFSLPEFSKPVAEELLDQTNQIAARAFPVEVRFLSAEEFARRPELVRVAAGKTGADGVARLIDIVGFDVQADGGTHVRSTREVGRLALERIENKGAKNKRLYLTLDAREPPTPT